MSRTFYFYETAAGNRPVEKFMNSREAKKGILQKQIKREAFNMKSLQEYRDELCEKDLGLSDRLDRRMEQLEISEHLRAARKAAGMTQKEVAEQMHVARARISKLESHPQNITLETLMRYTEAVGAKFSMNIGSRHTPAALA